jgi:hypothetical protein
MLWGDAKWNFFSENQEMTLTEAMVILGNTLGGVS